jgi:hypothetical protein
MAEYKLTLDPNLVIRTSDNANIPNDPDNSDWKIYQEWLAAGNVPDPVDIEDRRHAQLNKLMEKREQVIDSDILVNGKTYFMDPVSQGILNQALTVEGLGIRTVFPMNWILADGSVAVVTIEQMKAVASAMSQRVNQSYDNYMYLVGQIYAAENPEDVDLDQGWPTTL